MSQKHPKQSLCHHYADQYAIEFERDLNKALETGNVRYMMPIS